MERTHPHPSRQSSVTAAPHANAPVAQFVPHYDDAERWLPVPDLGGYHVSNHGRVRGPKGIRKTPINGAGYMTVPIYDRSVKRARGYGVHQLVAWAFLGPCPDDCEIEHLDRNKQHNHPRNLSYVTRLENMRRMHAVCRMKRKLSDDQVREIRALRGKKYPREVAQQYGISTSHVGNLWSGHARPKVK